MLDNKQHLVMGLGPRGLRAQQFIDLEIVAIRHTRVKRHLCPVFFRIIRRI